MRTVKFICLFRNGNIAVCDEKGKQIPKLQENVITRIFKEAKKIGLKLDDNMEILLPCGTARKLKGYDNYKVLEEAK